MITLLQLLSEMFGKIRENKTVRIGRMVNKVKFNGFDLLRRIMPADMQIIQKINLSVKTFVSSKNWSSCPDVY